VKKEHEERELRQGRPSHKQSVCKSQCAWFIDVEWVGRHVDGRLVVIVDKCGGMKRTMKLRKKLTEPTTLGNNMSHSPILSLSTGARNPSLALGRPRNQTVSIVDTITQGRATRIRTAGLIRIRISYQCGKGRSSLTRVNSTNVQDEGLRIGGKGRWMNSKVKISQTRRVSRINVVVNLAYSQFVPDWPLLTPIYRWSCLKEPVGSNTYHNIDIRHGLVL
jgi:hypothetical protein